MNVSHSHLMKTAELQSIAQKNRLDYGSETTSFRSRNRPVKVASLRALEPEALRGAA